MKQYLLKRIYSIIAGELEESIPEKQYCATLKLNMLMFGWAFKDIPAEEITEELRLRPSYATEVYKMQALWRLMKKKGLTIEDENAKKSS